MFAISNDRYYPSHTERKQKTTKILPPGIYEFDVEGGMFFQRPVFIPEKFREGLVDLKGQPFDRIKRRLVNFFKESTKEIYKDTQIRHFIGMLIYGPPGTGKTCFIDLVSQHFATTHGAITLRLKDAEHLDNLTHVVNLMRDNDESKMVILMLEELDKVMDGGYGRSKCEKWLIDFCDGKNTPSNVLMIASTNHIDKIPDSLKNRPSRFSIVDEVNAIPQAIANQLIEKLVPEKYRTKINISELSYKVTEERITIDQVKYIVLNMLCDDLTVEEAMYNVTTKPGVVVPEDEEGEDID